MDSYKLPTVRQLQYLVALAETKHFRKAAEALGITQPSLSVQLRTLESTLNTRLAERGRGGVVFTPIGREVAELARRVLYDVQAIVDLTDSVKSGLGGTLRLGAPPTLGPYLLPHVIKRLHKEQPDLKVYVREAPHGELMASVLDGSFDLILTHLPIASSDVVVERLFREPLYFVCANDHPLARKDEIKAKDLRNAQMLALEAQHNLHDKVSALCQEFGAHLLRDYEGTSLDTLRHMVGSGLGVTFLPALYVRSEIGARGEVSIAKVQSKPVHRTIGLVWRKHQTNVKGYRHLADVIRAAVSAKFKDITVM